MLEKVGLILDRFGNGRLRGRTYRDAHKHRFEKGIVFGEGFQHDLVARYVDEDRQGVFCNRLYTSCGVREDSSLNAKSCVFACLHLQPTKNKRRLYAPRNPESVVSSLSPVWVVLFWRSQAGIASRGLDSRRLWKRNESDCYSSSLFVFLFFGNKTSVFKTMTQSIKYREAKTKPVCTNLSDLSVSMMEEFNELERGHQRLGFRETVREDGKGRTSSNSLGIVHELLERHELYFKYVD